jgi:hypothetical protein
MVKDICKKMQLLCSLQTGERHAFSVVPTGDNQYDEIFSPGLVEDVVSKRQRAHQEKNKRAQKRYRERKKVQKSSWVTCSNLKPGFFAQIFENSLLTVHQDSTQFWAFDTRLCISCKRFLCQQMLLLQMQLTDFPPTFVQLNSVFH